jgi:hypothetical protein
MFYYRSFKFQRLQQKWIKLSSSSSFCVFNFLTILHNTKESHFYLSFVYLFIYFPVVLAFGTNLSIQSSLSFVFNVRQVCYQISDFSCSLQIDMKSYDTGYESFDMHIHVRSETVRLPIRSKHTAACSIQRPRTAPAWFSSSFCRPWTSIVPGKQEQGNVNVIILREFVFI